MGDGDDEYICMDKPKISSPMPKRWRCFRL